MSRVKRLGSSVVWGAVSTATTTLLQLGLLAVMARLLQPADYGLVATAGVALRFLQYFAQMGIVQSIIQKPELDDGDVAAALHVSLRISAIATLAALIAAPTAQWLFAMPGLAWVVAALSLNFLFGAVANVATGLLRRRLDFRAIALVEIASYALGYGAVGLPTALAHAHAWALVAAALTQSAVGTLALAYFALRGRDWWHDHRKRRHFVTQGGKFAIVGFLEFISSCFDAMVIGRFLGPAAAGVYNRAQMLANLPADRPAGILTRALFPFLSEMHAERDKQAISVQLSFMLVGGYAFAVSAGICIAAPDVVAVLLGPRWLGAIPVLSILALAVGPMFVTHVVGTTFDALGLLRRKLKVQVAMIVFLAIAFAVAFEFGVTGIAAAVVLAEWARAVVYVILLQREFRFAAAELRLFAAVALAGAGFVAAGSGLGVMLAPAGAPAIARLAIEAAFAAIGLAAALIALRPLLRRSRAVNAVQGRIRLLDRFLGRAGDAVAQA